MNWVENGSRHTISKDNNHTDIDKQERGYKRQNTPINDKLRISIDNFGVTLKVVIFKKNKNDKNEFKITQILVLTLWLKE